MAISTYQTYLMHKASASDDFSKLVDISSFGDLGGTPEQLDVTTLSDNQKLFINGIQSTEAISFEANYDKTTFTTLKALENKSEEYAVWLGASTSGTTVTPDGSNGKFTFTGQLSCFLKGNSVNNAQVISITISPSTEIKFS